MISTKSAIGNQRYSAALQSAAYEPRHYPREMVFGKLSTPIMSDQHDLNESVEAHEHSFMEVALVAAGKGNHLTVGGENRIAAGDVIVVQPGQWHAYVGCEHLLVRNCCFGAELLEAELAWVKDEPGLSGLLRTARSPEPIVLRLPPAAITQCLSHLDALVPQSIEAATSIIPGRQSRAALVGHLLLFLAEIGRYAQADFHAVIGKASHPAALKLLQLLSSDLAHPWTLTELTQACGDIDETYLIRLFRRETGETPMGYLARLRATRAAARLLRYPDESIAQVGAAVGWFDANYFARRFRQFYNQSPTEFRAQAQRD